MKDFLAKLLVVITILAIIFGSSYGLSQIINQSDHKFYQTRCESIAVISKYPVRFDDKTNECLVLIDNFWADYTSLKENK